MESMCLKLSLVVVRCLLGPLSMFRPMAYTFGLIGSPNNPNIGYNCFQLLTLSHNPPPLPPAHPLICATHDITVVEKRVAQNPAVLASCSRDTL